MTIYRRYGISLLIALLVSVYTLTNAGRLHIVDEFSLFAVTESLALRGKVDTNAIAWTQWVNSPGEVLGAFGPDGQVYSKKGPAPAFLAVPWYLLLRWVARLDIAIGLLQGTMLWNGLVTACTAALLWLTASRLGYGDRTGALLALLFGLCTIAWPYANHFFGEPLSAFSLLLCFYGLLSARQTGKVFPWIWLAGIGAGLTIATVTAHVLLIAILALYLLDIYLLGGRLVEKAAKQGVGKLFVALPAFVLPILLAGALLLWYNKTRFGAPFATGYHFESGEGFTTPIWRGFWGLMVSPYRGVFWHTPLFLATLFAFPTFRRRHPAEGLTLATLSLGLIGLYSAWWMWWGGFAWGPRFLVPLAPFWVLMLAPLLDRLKLKEWRSVRYGGLSALILNLGDVSWSVLALVFLALLSFGVQVLAVSVNYANYETQLRQIFPTDWQDPLKFGPPAQSLRDWRYSPVIGQWQLLRTDFKANTNLAWLGADGRIHSLIVLVGLATLITLGMTLWRWWVNSSVAWEPDALPSRPVRWALPLLPLLLIGVWLAGSARDPNYGAPGQGYRSVLGQICQEAKPDDAIVTIAPYTYQIPMNWMAACRQIPPIFGYASDNMNHPETQQVLNNLLQTHARVWFVTGGLPVNDPDNTVERWLANAAFKAGDDWHDDYRLVRYGTVAQLTGTLMNQIGTPLDDKQGQQILLMAARAPAKANAGEIIPVEIHYQLETPVTDDLHWFVQLLSAEGNAVALIDTAPAQGYTPFSQLPVGQEQVERAGLQLAENLKPGEYHLIAGLYDPAANGAARLTLPNGRDFVDLGPVTVK
ncbi:MAG: hypothetical protein U0350_16490 [Caldilineaceae bacterium]